MINHFQLFKGNLFHLRWTFLRWWNSAKDKKSYNKFFFIRNLRKVQSSLTEGKLGLVDIENLLV
jgi:hypothetical protein